MKKEIIISIIVLAVIAFAWGVLIEPNSLEVNRVEVQTSAKLQKDLKIAVIADLHIGVGFTDINRLKEIVKKVNETKPDLIINLGDYHAHMMGVSGIDFQKVSQILSQLKAKYGVYSILGNHDGLIVQHKWLDGAYKPLDEQKQMIVDLVENSQMTLLDDMYVLINVEGSEIAIAGLTDKYSTSKNYAELLISQNIKKPDYKNLPAVLNQIPDDVPLILLNHSPDIFPDVPDNVTLTLAGHMHKGHINLPVINKLMAPSIYSDKYLYGLYKEGNKQLYVTSGIGGFPVRINAKPEVAIITLKGKS